MALTGDHLTEFGQLKELERAKRELNEMKLERDVAKQERDATIQEFNTATQKLEEAFDTIDSLKKSIALLESELAKSQKVIHIRLKIQRKYRVHSHRQGWAVYPVFLHNRIYCPILLPPSRSRILHFRPSSCLFR